MRNDKNKIQEPFSPEHTPNPPQIIDPSGKDQHNPKENPVKEEPRNSSKPAGEEKSKETKKPSEGASKNKLMSEETEISDETTI